MTVTRPWGKLYVLILSDLSPVPIWFFLFSDLSLSFSFSDYTALNIFNAFALFLCWDFSSCWLTTTPVGKWVLTALSVVLTDWPPAANSKTSILNQCLLCRYQLPLPLVILQQGCWSVNSSLCFGLVLSYSVNLTHILNKNNICTFTENIISLKPPASP